MSGGCSFIALWVNGTISWNGVVTTLNTGQPLIKSSLTKIHLLNNFHLNFIDEYLSRNSKELY